jgi:hypothetical protein
MVTEAVVVKIDQTQYAARLEDIEYVLHYVKRLGTVILEDKSDPDKIKTTQILERFPDIFAYIVDIVFFVMFLGIVDSLLRIINAPYFRA